MRGWKERLRDEGGAALILVAGTLVVILGFAALAVDAGNLYMIRTESQRTADAAALACAGHLLIDSDDSLGAANRAIEFAAKNSVAGSPAVILPGDVDLDMPNWTCTTRLYHTADRGNAPGTFFAKVLGINSVDVVTFARAWAAPANGVEPGGTIEDCVLPVGILDFEDLNGDGNIDTGEYPHGFDQDDHGKLLKLTVSGSSPGGPPVCQTEPAWDAATQTGVWNANPDVDYCNQPEESWSCWWKENEQDGGGTTDLGQAILGNNCADVFTGDTLYQASAGGEKTSLVQADDAAGGPGSFRDVIELDLAASGGNDLVWCPTGEGGSGAVGCPMRGSCGGTCVTESPRLRAAPVLSPATVGGSGANNAFTVTGITGLFIERVSCAYDAGQFGGPAGQWNVYVRLMTAQSQGSSGGDTPPDEDALVRELKLIE
jgi:Flp pilus assembly protein TadG